MGEATREAPAQAELRPPTSARAFRVILPCDVTPVYHLPGTRLLGERPHADPPTRFPQLTGTNS
jgi:hypothetical protein